MLLKVINILKYVRILKRLHVVWKRSYWHSVTFICTSILENDRSEYLFEMVTRVAYLRSLSTAIFLCSPEPGSSTSPGAARCSSRRDCWPGPTSICWGRETEDVKQYNNDTTDYSKYLAII